MFCRKKPLSHRAVTLVEVMMVLGIFAFILGIIMTIFSLVEESRNVAAFMEEISVAKDIAYQLFLENNPSVSDVANPTETLQKSGLLPNRYFTSNGQMISPFGTTISLIVAAWGTHGVTFWMSNVPQSYCVSIGSQGLEGNGDIDNIRINGALIHKGDNATIKNISSYCVPGSNTVAISYL